MVGGNALDARSCGPFQPGIVSIAASGTWSVRSVRSHAERGNEGAERGKSQSPVAFSPHRRRRRAGRPMVLLGVSQNAGPDVNPCRRLAGVGGGAVLSRRPLGRLPGVHARGHLFRPRFRGDGAGPVAAEPGSHPLAHHDLPIPGLAWAGMGRSQTAPRARRGTLGTGRLSGGADIHGRLAGRRRIAGRAPCAVLRHALGRLLGRAAIAADRAGRRGPAGLPGPVRPVPGGHRGRRVLPGVRAGLATLHRPDARRQEAGVHRAGAGAAVEPDGDRHPAGRLLVGGDPGFTAAGGTRTARPSCPSACFSRWPPGAP